jgi:biotin/methionine sulfoxide reductase
VNNHNQPASNNKMKPDSKVVPTCTHWGNYRVETDGKRIVAVHNYDVDAEPTAIGQSLLDALDPGARIPQPMVREG